MADAGRPPGSRALELEIELVDVVPFGGRALVRVAGRWRGGGPDPDEAPILIIDDGLRAHRFGALPGPAAQQPEPWRVAFAVPSVLVEIPEASFSLQAGGTVMRLARPAPTAPGSPAGARPRPASQPGMVDRAVLAERRARRAELAEEEQARRASQARSAAAAAQAELAALSQRVEDAVAERTALERRVADSVSSLRRPRQEAEAAERVRLETLEEAARHERVAETERSALRERLRAATQRARELEAQLEALER